MELDKEEMILDARVDGNGNLKDEDLEELQNHAEFMVRMNNKSSEAMYKHYQNLWHDYFCHKKIKEEFNNVALTAFFNSMIYSCINSYMIDQYGCNLTRLVRLTRHLKMETSHYVSKKSQTFTAEQIHEVISHCMCAEINDPKERSLAFA